MTADSKTRAGLLFKVFQFPITRIAIALLFVLVAVGVVQGMLKWTGGLFDNIEVFTVLVLPAAFAAYWGYVRSVEHRTPTEIAFAGSFKEFGFGVLLGTGLFSVTIGIIAALGYYHVTGMNRWNVVVESLALAVMAGFLEELLTRGIIFRILEEWLGTWIALAISAAMFGAMHLGNPNATLASAVAIALEAGLLLAACYVLTRRLWLAAGLHVAWNFTQGGIFGVSVSGTGANGILQSTLTGPSLLSGGAFGAEASIVAVVVCVSGFLFIITQARSKGHILPPPWMTSQRTTT